MILRTTCHATLIAALFISIAAIYSGPASSAAESSSVVLHGHMSPALHEHSIIGTLDPSSLVKLTVVLPLRNREALDTLIVHLYDPQNEQYGQYLSQSDFASQFGPTLAQYNSVASYLSAHGLKVTNVHDSRAIIDVQGTAAAVRSAFNVVLNRYSSNDGRSLYGPGSEPSIPASLSGNIASVIGLDNFVQRAPHLVARPSDSSMVASPSQIGTGPGGGLAPSDIRKAYNLASISATGSGQTLAVFELDGFNSSDISNYASAFGLPTPSIQTILVDGAAGSAGSATDEVCLDLELQLAIAPRASKFLCYEGPNSDRGVIDTYQRIADDDKASSISTSWGAAESQSSSATLVAEAQIFAQMAAQGQSIFAASGDSGADADGKHIGVEDPASQPYVCGVGGTQLSVSASGSYLSETTWNVNGTPSGGAGGGGISTQWAVPSYQTGLATPSNLASSTNRNVPDVSFNADQYTGYSVYVTNKWWIYGGTSAAAPIWAAFVALVNQQRAAGSQPPIGFPNTLLYQIGKGTGYATAFHDIANGSTNLHYPAVVGYDCATGWGSFNGANMLASLSSGQTSTPAIPIAPVTLGASATVSGPVISWTASSGATGYNVYRSTSSVSGFGKIGSASLPSPYNDPTGQPGVAYYYDVTATNTGGESAASNVAGPVSATAVAPTNVSAVVNGTSVRLAWSTSTGATSYNIYRSSNPTSGYAVVGTTTASPYNDPAVNVAQSYYYEVSAVTSGIESAKSAFAGPVSVPLAVPGGLAAQAVSGNISVTWNPVTGASAYKVYRSTNASTGFLQVAAPSTSSYLDVAPISGQAYYYKVSAIVIGSESQLSAAVGPVMVAIPVPATPSITALSPSTTTAGSATFTVTISGTNFIAASAAFANGVPLPTVYSSASVLTASISAALISSPGTLSLTVSNSTAVSSSAANMSVSAAAIPSAPTNVGAAASGTNINITWSASAGATSYKVYRSTVPTTNFVLAGSASASPYSESAPMAGQTYYYAVTAVTGSAESAKSVVAGPVTIPLSAPTGVAVSLNVSNNISLTWNAVVGASAYKVYRSSSSSTGFGQVAAPSASPYVDISALAGQTYYYEASAIVIGTESPLSLSVGPVTMPIGPPPIPTPSISSVSPSAIAAGSAAFTLIVSGSNFTSASAIAINGVKITTTYLSSSYLTASVSALTVATPSTLSVTVINSSSSSSPAVSLAVTGHLAPTPYLGLLSPSTCLVGQTTTMFAIGNNFDSTSKVFFNGIQLTTTLLSSGLLSATIPSTSVNVPGTVQVQVKSTDATLPSGAVPFIVKL